MAKGTGIWNTLKRTIHPRGFILMYHRIRHSAADPFDLSVAPDNFEQHIACIAQNCTPVPLSEISMAVKKRVPFPVAVSFDDGYLDNFETAVPILEKYNVPATFFITTGYFAHSDHFWWDILEICFFETTKLPGLIVIPISSHIITLNIEGEETLTEALKERNRQWKYGTSTQTKRSASFLELWQVLKSTDEQTRTTILGELISQTQLLLQPGQRMTLKQINQVHQHNMFSIGAHSVFHNPLAQLSESEQLSEISGSLIFLQEVCGQPLKSFAYPYGSYNHSTLKILKELNIDRSVTTNPSRVTAHSSPLELPRINVSNLSGKMFQDIFHYIQHQPH